MLAFLPYVVVTLRHWANTMVGLNLLSSHEFTFLVLEPLPASNFLLRL